MVFIFYKYKQKEIQKVTNADILRQLSNYVHGGLTQSERQSVIPFLHKTTGIRQKTSIGLNYPDTLFDLIEVTTDKHWAFALRNALFVEYGLIRLPGDSTFYFMDKIFADMFAYSNIRFLQNFELLDIFFANQFTNKKHEISGGIAQLIQRSSTFAPRIANLLENKLLSIERDIRHSDAWLPAGVVFNFIEFLVELWWFHIECNNDIVEKQTSFSLILNMEDRKLLKSAFSPVQCKLKYYLNVA